MNSMELLNTMFILPAIKSGIRERIWENDELKLSPIKEIWKNLGLLDNNNKLSDLGLEIYNLHPLIDYFLSLKEDYEFYTPHENGNYTINDNQYSLLREGLEIYHNHHNKNLFNQYKLRNKKWLVLDYAGGRGQYLIDFIKDNPESNGLLIDRKAINRLSFGDRIISKGIDFEEDLEWYQNYENTFDMIILSELLHCKDKLLQEYIITTCWYMLKPNGLLFINEIIPNPIFDWRMNMYTKGGKSISIEDINKLTKNQFIEHSINKNNYHYQVLLTAKKGN